MSCNFTRIISDPAASKTYGYQKVSPHEMKALILRVQKPTHSSDVGGYFPDGYFKHPHRPTSGLCKKASPGDLNLLKLTTGKQRRPLSPKSASRLTRRLQTPTLSRQAAYGMIVPEYEYDTSSGSEAPKAKTPEEKNKFLRRITRPTTASKRKDFDNYWAETIDSDYYDRDFSDDHCANKEEINSIVARVRTPTVASERGEKKRCSRRRPSEHIDRDKLPLVSGLARSRRVEEIVERLYRPTTASSARQTTPVPRDTSPRAHSRQR